MTKLAYLALIRQFVASGLGYLAWDKLARGRVQQQSEEFARRVSEQQQSTQQEQQCGVPGSRTSFLGLPEMWHLS